MALQVRWVAKKTVDANRVAEKIKECEESGIFTNDGPNVKQLQEDIKQLLSIDSNREVLMTCNGAAGLNAIAGGLAIHWARSRPLRWVTQAFTFPCAIQGAFMGAKVVDLDPYFMGPNMEWLEEHVDEYDGVIVTNCFGALANLRGYSAFCKNEGKFLVLDNAATPCSIVNFTIGNALNYGDAVMVSLHHTKPIGFGEGGFIVFRKEYKEAMERAICFGYTVTDKTTHHVAAGNYKMSEIAAVYVCEYLRANIHTIRLHHSNMVNAFIKDGGQLINTFQFTVNGAMLPIYSCLPVLLPEEGDHKDVVEFFIAHGVEAKKYYRPLVGAEEAPNAWALYNRIVCLPLNMQTTKEHIALYLKLLGEYGGQGRSY